MCGGQSCPDVQRPRPTRYGEASDAFGVVSSDRPVQAFTREIFHYADTNNDGSSKHAVPPVLHVETKLVGDPVSKREFANFFK